MVKPRRVQFYKPVEFLKPVSQPLQSVLQSMSALTLGLVGHRAGRQSELLRRAQFLERLHQLLLDVHLQEVPVGALLVLRGVGRPRQVLHGKGRPAHVDESLGSRVRFLTPVT